MIENASTDAGRYITLQERIEALGGPWKVGNEWLPYHPSASHVSPDHRDGWNYAYLAALAAAPQKAAVPASPPVFSGYLKVVGMPDTERRLQWDEPATPQGAEPVADVVAPLNGKYGNVLAPFVALMEAELHANSRKGDRPGWLSMLPSTVLLEIYWHTAKLSQAVHTKDDHAIREHSADVANMAMMLLDVCGGLNVTAAHESGRQQGMQAAPQALSVGAATLEFAGWQQRYIDPEEGPSIWLACDDTSARVLAKREDHELRAVYAMAATPPPAAPAAVPLTDEQIDAIAEPFVREIGGGIWHSGDEGIRDWQVPEFARAIERAHGIGATPPPPSPTAPTGARGWDCSKCGTDRTKEPCPRGHHAALTGDCPMVGVAQHAPTGAPNGEKP